MKKNLLLLLLVIASVAKQPPLSAQAPNWQWAKWAGGTQDEFVYGVTTDAGGNVYVTGYSASDSITFGTTTLTNAGIDMFIAKYDASGNVLWAKRAGGLGYTQGFGVTTDAGGNVYVTGDFQSDSITFGTTTLTNTNTFWGDMFIVKYDSSGTVLWAKSAGGSGTDYGYGVSTDAGGNVYVAGHFVGSITFGTTTLTGTGYETIFIAKYDASGTVLWAKSAGGTDHNLVNDIFTDAGGNSYVTGYFSSPSITFGTTTLTNAGGHDMFIAKYDASGTELWAKSAGDTVYAEGYGVSTDAGGNAYVTGVFDAPSITFGTTTLTNAGSYGYDMFITKYDASGTVLWAKSAGGTDSDYGYGVSTDAGGNAYVAGYFFSPSIAFGTTTLINAGNQDMLIAKYDSSGTALWAKSVGGPDNDVGIGASTDAGGNVYVAGDFYSPSITFGTTTMANAGGYDMYIARLDTVISPASCSAGFTLQPDTVPHNWFVLNTANGTPPLTYLWNWGDGTTSTGATPSHTYSTPAYYNICLAINDSTGCYSSYCDSSTYIYKTEQTMITVNCVLQLPNGINNPTADAIISIHPNPGTTSVTISIDESMLDGTVTICDITGREILMSNIEHRIMNIETARLSSGVYFVAISNGKSKATKKLIIQK